MRCEQTLSYIPGYAGGDLDSPAAALVDGHLRTCPSCRAESERHARVRLALSALAVREVEPPPQLLDALLDGARRAPSRRLLPVPPVAPLEVLRVLQENRDAIVSAASAAVVAAGAGYALWRAIRGLRPRPAPAQ